jgi:hypothetical protein
MGEGRYLVSAVTPITNKLDQSGKTVIAIAQMENDEDQVLKLMPAGTE